MEEETKQNAETNPVQNQEKKVNTCCLLSFIFSLVALFIFGIPLGIAAIVLGIIGIVKFKKDSEKFRWMGIVGLCLGLLDVISVSLYTVRIY